MSQKNTLFNYFTKSPATSKSTNETNTPKTPQTPKTPKTESTRKRSFQSPSTPKSSKKKSKINSPENSQTEFEELDIVWAKLSGYPWWPSIVCRHPTSDKFQRLKDLHVQFFDDPPTHAWVPKSCIETYGKGKKFAPIQDKDKWEKSVKDADEALKTPQEDRTKLLFDFSKEDSYVDTEEGSCSRSLSNWPVALFRHHSNSSNSQEENRGNFNDNANFNLNSSLTNSTCSHSFTGIESLKLEDKIQHLEKEIESQKKLNNIIINKKCDKNYDEIDLFYQSISLSVKRFPKYLINQAKMEHLRVISNLEKQFLNEKIPKSSDSILEVPRSVHIRDDLLELEVISD